MTETLTTELRCPQCGEPTEQLHEGYCEACSEERQMAVLLHNAQFDRWERMTEAERAAEIRWAMS